MPLAATIRCSTAPIMPGRVVWSGTEPLRTALSAYRPFRGLRGADQLAFAIAIGVGDARRVGDHGDVGGRLDALAGVVIAIHLTGHLADLEHDLVDHRTPRQVGF